MIFRARNNINWFWIVILLYVALPVFAQPERAMLDYQVDYLLKTYADLQEFENKTDDLFIEELNKIFLGEINEMEIIDRHFNSEKVYISTPMGYLLRFPEYYAKSMVDIVAWEFLSLPYIASEIEQKKIDYIIDVKFNIEVYTKDLNGQKTGEKNIDVFGKLGFKYGKEGLENIKFIKISENEITNIANVKPLAWNSIFGPPEREKDKVYWSIYTTFVGSLHQLNDDDYNNIYKENITNTDGSGVAFGLGGDVQFELLNLKFKIGSEFKYQKSTIKIGDSIEDVSKDFDLDIDDDPCIRTFEGSSVKESSSFFSMTPYVKVIPFDNFISFKNGGFSVELGAGLDLFLLKPKQINYSGKFTSLNNCIAEYEYEGEYVDVEVPLETIPTENSEFKEFFNTDYMVYQDREKYKGKGEFNKFKLSSPVLSLGLNYNHYFQSKRKPTTEHSDKSIKGFFIGLDYVFRLKPIVSMSKIESDSTILARRWSEYGIEEFDDYNNLHQYSEGLMRQSIQLKIGLLIN